MKKIFIIGPESNIFAQVLLKEATNLGSGIEVKIINEDIDNEITKLKDETIFLINKGESLGLSIKEKNPELLVIVVHGGGEKQFQPMLTMIDHERNHQYVGFHDWSDFLNKIKNPPSAKPLLFSALDKDNYRVNYENFPELADRLEAKLEQKFFYFSLYFSRLYLNWFSEWIRDTKSMCFPFVESFKLGGEGKLKRLVIPFRNSYKGEMIFREGEGIRFSPYKGFISEGKESFVGTIISADDEGIEVFFPKAIPKKLLSTIKNFHKGGNLLEMITDIYRDRCSGFSDLSEKDFFTIPGNEYYTVESFFRGINKNHNKLSPKITEVKLDGMSKVILRDESQGKALLDLLSPTFLSIVSGPPGTGKTLLPAVAIKQFMLQRGHTVLIVAHSNQGLDNLVETLTNHISDKKIYRLGNDSKLISEKAKKFHRQYRYRKQIEKEREDYEKTRGVNAELIDEFNDKERAVFYETESIWDRICKGESLVLATTINSYQTDRTIKRLFWQNDLIFGQDSIEVDRDPLIPRSVAKFMAADPKLVKPSFMIDTVVIDEATKGFPFELVPLIKAANSKLVLIGDPDQLGNLNISLDVQNYITGRILTGLHKERKNNTYRTILYPSASLSDDHPLVPIETTYDEMVQYFSDFCSGLFSSLITRKKLERNLLMVNRRSLPEITNFVNYVFKKNLEVGRFDPTTEGKVVFLDVSGSEKKIKTSYRNDAEKSIASREIIKYFLEQNKKEGKICFSHIGCITTYRGQIQANKERLRNEFLYHPAFTETVNANNIDQVLSSLINTVDAFQGSERKVIICSLVRANPDGTIGFLEDIRRLYVAMTRAKDSLIIIGNSEVFLKAPGPIREIFGRIVHYTQTKKTYSRKKVVS